jgi:uridine kinase
MSHVIAVSGYPGAGKTSLVLGLAQALGDAAPIHMDSYERVTRAPIEDIARWLRDGADIDAFDFPQLEEDLVHLRQGLPLEDRYSGNIVTGSRYVLFETQFGRAHTRTGRHIGLQIWIDVPRDIALARKLKAFLGGFLRENQPDKLPSRTRWLEGYLDNYLGTVSALLEMQHQRVAGTADIVVDGRLDLRTMIETVRGEILRRLP